MLTAVSAAMRSAVRRTSARRKSRTGQSATARRIAQQLSPLQPHAHRDEQQPDHEHGGDRDEDDQPRVRVGEHAREHRDHQGDEHHGRRRGDQRPDDRERVAHERAVVITTLATSGSHVGDERVEIGGRQAAVLGRHRRLLGRLGLRRRLGRMRDPLLDVVGRQLRADAVERIRLAALCRRWRGRPGTSARCTPPLPSCTCAGGRRAIASASGDSERRREQEAIVVSVLGMEPPMTMSGHVRSITRDISGRTSNEFAVYGR